MIKTLLVIAVLFLQQGVISEQISCQGKIDFKNADIEVKNIKLQSIMKSGSKGYQVILMNDASYSIPIDSSKHTIYLRPLAAGFLFEPKEYKLTPQELKQHCNSESPKKNFDFILTGFQIESKVLSKKSSSPIKDIKVSITSQSQKKQLVSKTDENGVFSFNQIMPETYIMKIEQDPESDIKWERSQIQCQASVPKVQRKYEECSQVMFLATGFSVMGSVFVKNGSALNGVQVKISPKDASKENEFCSKYQCTTLTNGIGIFQFLGVEQGQFTVEAVKTELMAEFVPKNLSVAVGSESVILNEIIKLTHISKFQAAIVSEIDPTKTKVTLLNTNDEQSSKLQLQNNSRKIKFPNLEVNSLYKLKVQSHNYVFDQIQILVQSPLQIQNKILNVQAKLIQVCGEIKMKGKVETASNRGIKFQYLDDAQKYQKYKTIVVDKDGKFCDYLQPNKYRIVAELTKQDKQKNTVFRPNQIKIELKQKPILDLKFEQASIHVLGYIFGFKAAKIKRPNIQISLINNSNTQVPPIIKSVEVPKKAIDKKSDQVLIKFDFQNVGAGDYIVRVSSSIYCFVKDEIDVNVTGELANVELKELFIKTGYNFNYRANYAIEDAQITRKDGKNLPMNNLLLAKGMNSLCVPSQGQYFINIPQCYLMKNKVNSIPFTVPINSLGSNVQEVLIELQYFGISGSVYIKDYPTQSSTAISNQQESFLKEIDNIIGVGIKQSRQLKQLYKDDSSSETKYNYMVFEDAGLKINIMLQKFANITSEQLNFYNHLIINPKTIQMTMSQNCKVYQDFFISVGVIIHGQTQPALQQVKVTMIDKFTQQVIQSVTTDQKGLYSFDPIDPSTQITLTSELDGYALSNTVQKQSQYILKMKKLSQLFLKVIDGDSKEPISGARLLLSSSIPTNQNKQKQQHNSDIQQVEPGHYKFNKIKSGKGQRLQVMLRQYQFDDHGVMDLDIKDGETKRAQIYGHRVTFSAYGTVIQGDLKKMENVLIKARCLDNSLCNDNVHQSITDSKGQFRIEELKPMALYELRVFVANQKGKDSQIDESQYEVQIETKIQKCVPEMITINMQRKDITDLEFVVKMESPFINMQGQVQFEDEIINKTMKDIINEPELELTLLEVFQSNKKPSHITTQKLTKTRVFLVNKLKRASKYKVTVKSSSKKYLEMSQTLKGEQFENYLTLMMGLNKQAGNQEFKPQTGSPAFGFLLLTAIVGGFIYYKRQ